MSEHKLDADSLNNDIGLYWEKCRRVAPSGAPLPFTVGEIATGMIATTAGVVVTRNTISGINNIVPFEAGEWKPIVYDQVLASATIDGVLETTTASGLYWTTSPAKVAK